MTQDNSPANVINFKKLGRRKGVARLTKNYSSMLAHILSCSELDDGEHVDENDLPITRALDRTESRHGAVVTAAQFFYTLMLARAKMETPSDGADDLYAFEFRASGRIKRYHEANLGKYKIVVPGKYKRDLMAIERNYFQAIFDALRIEARNDPELNEADFWADVLRGMSDADPSGVVLRAAGLVLLDHIPHFQHALAQHSAHALRK